MYKHTLYFPCCEEMTMEMSTSFGDWIRRRRKALDLTQEALAEQVGCSVALIRKVESDARRPSRQVAELLARALVIDPKDQALFLKVARGERMTERLGIVPPPTHAVPTHAAPATPTVHLPVPSTPLIGREAELAELRRMLLLPECRLLTLVGPGGIGKTRLAIAAAAAQAQLFGDGVYFVALAPVSAQELIVPAIAHALGLVFSNTSDPKDQLLTYLHQKQLLIVLDNLEHLLPPASALNTNAENQVIALLSELLAYAPHLKLFVTSRERLHLLAEWVFDLHGLSTPPLALPAAPGYEWECGFERYGAIALFTASAQRVQKNFTLSNENRDDVARICRLVEGMPLGIELAAAWVHLLSCHEIAQEIAQNLDFLTVPLRDVPERHRSMKAVFAHSWHLLTPEEQDVLCRLAVFRGGFDRAAATAVAKASLPLLSALVAKSLLRRSTTGRYDLHELVRQYADEQLQERGGTQQARDAHLHYFLTLAEQAEPELNLAQPEAWLVQLELDHANLQAALAWVLESRQVDLGLRLAGALWPFWYLRNYIREGRHWLEAVLALHNANAEVNPQDSPAYTPISRAALAKVWSGAGILAWVQNDNARAKVLLAASAAEQRAVDDKRGLAISLYYLGAAALRDSEPLQGIPYLEESLALQRMVGNKQGIARVLNGLGWMAIECDDLTHARTLFEESLALNRQLGDRINTANVLDSLGWVALLAQDLTQAQAIFYESLALAQEVDDKHCVIACLEGLAAVTCLQGELGMAARFLGCANVVRDALGAASNTGGRSRYDRTVDWVRQQVGESVLAAAHPASLEQVEQFITSKIKQSMDSTEATLPMIAQR
jgi:predicted ATPase/DNA-binding XRE family transcriptional regulator